jgi:hypothetical protein
MLCLSIFGRENMLRTNVTGKTPRKGKSWMGKREMHHFLNQFQGLYVSDDVILEIDVTKTTVGL